MNELVALNQAEIDQLAIRAGADPNANRGPMLPILKVNTDDEDEAGNLLPRGQMFVQNGEQVAFAKEVTIRPLTMHYQYQHYDPDANKMANKTVLTTSFNEEFVDEKGGTRCGRPESKVYKKLDDDEKKRYKDISCTRQLGVLVFYEGTDAEGNKVKVENQPAFMRLKGSNFMPFDEEFAKSVPKGRKMWDYRVTVSLDKQKNGSVTYYIMHFAPDWNNPVPLDQPTFETMKYFLEMVDKENRSVREKYNEALRQKGVDDDVYDSIGSEADLNDDLEDA